jgi:hypothetical protein
MAGAVFILQFQIRHLSFDLLQPAFHKFQFSGAEAMEGLGHEIIAKAEAIGGALDAFDDR